mmetsp:Transcript_5213/g.14948  ORF Transcript_5213/g.14948 Transcript_5213/m.14948 type:complete len:86 (-) Transcript_5213:55-312(-)
MSLKPSPRGRPGTAAAFGRSIPQPVARVPPPLTMQLPIELMQILAHTRTEGVAITASAQAAVHASWCAAHREMGYASPVMAAATD